MSGTVLSQSGHVGLKTQTAKGTYKDPGAASPNKGVFMRVRSGALGGARELLIPDAEIGGNRDIPDAKLGPIKFSGQYDFYGRMESLATILAAALGTSAAPSGDAASGYTHVATPGDNLPWLSVEEQVGNVFEAFKYTDVVANEFHLEAAANGYLMGTVSMVGLTQQLLGSPTSSVNQRWDVSPLIVGTNIVCSLGGVQLPARNFSLDFKNNVEEDDFRLGSLYLGNVQPKRREATAKVTIRPDDAGYWREATMGASNATVYQGMPTYEDFEIVISTYEDIVGADPGTKYSLTIAVPAVVIKPFALAPSGDDVIQHDLELQFLRPDPADALITTTTVNSYATVA